MKRELENDYPNENGVTVDVWNILRFPKNFPFTMVREKTFASPNKTSNPA